MKASYPEQQPNVESLIVDNMNLVKKIAWHMHGRVRSAMEIEDLMQIGYYGLVTAAQKYSPKEGATFASYAVLRIRGAIVDHLRKKFKSMSDNNSNATKAKEGGRVFVGITAERTSTI